MSERASDAPADHLYHAQEAAKFLGIHRATLHLATKRNLLVPDSHTPGGHARFRRATLEAFAQRVSRQPVTSSDHLLSELAHTLPLPSGSQEFCQFAFNRIRQAVPALPLCGVAERSPTPADPHALKEVAHSGFSPQLGEIFAQLRPNLEFAVTAVVRTREPEICEDTTETQMMRLGTERLVRRGGLGAYAVLPLRLGDEVLGVLVVASPHPQRFPAGEVSFLQSIADDLAVALACHDEVARVRTQLAATAELTQRALRMRAKLSSGCHTTANRRRAGQRARAQAIAQLRTQLAEISTAALTDILLPAGFDGMADLGQLGEDDGEPARRLRELLSHAQAVVGPQRDRWTDENGPWTAIALSLPMTPDARLAVGAIWRGERVDPTADEALLVAFGGACVLLLDLGASSPGGSR